MSTQKDFYDKIKNDLSHKYVPSNPHDIKTKPIQSSTGIDMHIHGKNSTDGYMDFVDIINRSIQNNVEYISITDHNSFNAIKQIRQTEAVKNYPTYTEYDGVKIFTGTEISCEMHLSRQDYFGVHLLCYGFDLNSDNIFLHMINQKDKDYTMARYYPLYYLTCKNKIYSTTFSEFKEFAKSQANKDVFTGNLNYDVTVNFYKWKGIDEDLIKADLQGFDFFNPMRDSFRLDVVDVINATHSAGGYCIVAHPVRSFEKHRSHTQKNNPPHAYYTTLMDKLLSVGCDGIEYSNNNDECSAYFNNLYSNLFITSCGSDTHYYGHNSINDIGKFNNNVSELPINVVNKLLELDKAKRDKEQTKRQKQYNKIEYQSTHINF